MSKITNDGTGCFIAVPKHHVCSPSEND